MKLTRLTVNQFKQFRQPVTLDNLTDGINLFVGPNESGKSTLVRAIRAAFFERHKSSGVADLQPWDDSAAAPEVEVEFEWQNQTWKLQKRFLKRQRCDLWIGQEHISGDAAEEKLAQLLGYEIASRGASRAEHWGIPGLLWVEQGNIQNIHHSVDHAGHHLKSALSGTLGDITSTGGDELITQVENQRAALLTKTGQPTGQLKKIQQECDHQENELAELEDKVQRYHTSVDRLGQLLQQRDQIDSQKPWLPYRAKAKEAEAALAAVQALQNEQQRDQQALKSCQSNLEFCQQQLRDFEQRAQQLNQREAEKAKAARALAECQQLTAQLQQRREQAEQEFQKAKEALKAAREQIHRRNRQREHDILTQQLTQLQTNHKAAAELQTALQSLRAQLQTQAVDEKQLVRLKALHTQLNEIEIREQAIATRLHYDLQPGKSIQIDHQTINGSGEQLLLKSTPISIPGVGTLRILPGGNDINDLLRSRERIETEATSVLTQLKAASLAEAESRAAQNQQLAAQIDQHQTRLEMLAPKGVDAIASDLKLAEQQHQALTEELAKLPEATSSAIDERQVETALVAAEAALKAAEQADNEHLRELALRDRACESAKSEWQKLQAELQSPERQTRERETLDRLSLLKAEENQLRDALEKRQKEIDSENPAILQQDVARFTKSADSMEKEAADRGAEISALQIQLETLGAQGLEEARNTVKQEFERLTQRRQQLQRRAAALDLLLDLLKEKRQILTRQLQAPLQKHLNHYLNLLFPGATLTVDENLRPQILTRQNANAELEFLSFGAREQMGLISRLAYADLLNEAERPTLLILDDALVHSDDERLEQMKRVLFDAGQRHQVILFSCHPDRWQGLGVAARQVLQAI